ncbi:MAG: alpha/beta hydrolase family protein [Candidatus Rokuibacteriota bacterium]
MAPKHRHKARIVTALVGAIVLGGLGTVDAPQAASDVVETIWIPVTAGPASELRLEATLYRPSPAGSHPIVVFNHGSTGAGRQSPKATVRYADIARFFVERGMAVLIPMRRGRGASGGEYLERYDCDSEVLAAGVERASADLDAVMGFVAQQPWADTTRLVLGGMSRGAFLSIVYSSSRRTGARGVINFAGGWTVEHCDTRLGFHERMLAEAGRAALVPMLWLYAENDRNYGPAAIRSYHRAFTRAGGTADLYLFPPLGGDGHILLPRHAGVWSAAVSAFLDRVGLGRP